MDDSIRKLQLAELDILKQTLAIIEEHNLTYYMLGGTLLGAVRHKGFIPWDDDIDIGMPRPDYEQFLQYAKAELTPPYQLHTLHTNPGEYSYYYARVENTEIKILRKAALKEVVIPAWIDVFPLDGVPNDEKKREAWIKKCTIFKKVFRASQYSYFGISAERKVQRTLLKTVLRKIFFDFKLENLINTKQAWARLDKALKENNYHECDTVINFCGYWKLKEMFPKKVYGKGKLYPFEDIMLNGPQDYDYVLKQMYGDYMTPPPEDQRAHHFVEFITK